MLDFQSINQIKTGQSFVLKNNSVISAKWYHRLVRVFSFGLYNNDEKIAGLLIAHINKTKQTTYCKEALEAATNFVKVTRKSSEVFKRLENVLFAHRCSSMLSINVDNLINENGNNKNKLLSIIKNNHLHNIIYRANNREKDTAILFENNKIFIRSKNGENFLNSKDNIQIILNQMPECHPDRNFLSLLFDELNKPSKIRSEDVIKDLMEILKDRNYCYSNLDSFSTNEKGIFLTHHFLTDGMEEHHVTKWKEIKPAFIERCENLRKEKQYTLRIVTRLPDYALSNSKLGFMKGFIKNILNLSTHGHSWVQLVEPEFDEFGEFTKRQRVYDVGFYMWPNKRLQNADPMSYMPIPEKYLVVNETSISASEFKRGIFYLNKIQSLFLDPKKKLENDTSISKEDLENIEVIHSSIKGTCLSFANGVKEAITGIQIDDRGWIRRWICPKKKFKKLDKLDPIIEKTGIFKKIFNFISFLNRMELPHFRKPKPASN